MAKEATIQKILALEPIPGADRIEKATILGWSVVVEKGLYKVDDLVIYIFIDSVIPKKDQYAFIKSTKKLEDGTEMYYIRTIKLRGQLSQGLVLPISALPQGTTPTIGQDVSESLGVQHYEKPIPAQLSGQVKGNFPSFIPKTDETRIQSWPEALEAIQGKSYYISLKVDGTSGTFYHYNGNFGVCSRNLELKDTEENSFWRIAKKYALPEKLALLNKNLAIQGEVVGPGIQKNPLALKEIDLFVFNIFDIDTGKYFNFSEFSSIVFELGLKTVPILEKGTDFKYTQDQLLELAKGKYEGTNNHREGIVIRPMYETKTTKGERLSFKVVNNQYALQEE